MPKYYALEQTDSAAELYIFGDIAGHGQMSEDDPDRSAYNIINELKNISTDSVNVHINSMGGDVSEGMAIYNTLKNSGKKVTTYCDGFACSAASVVFMAGSERVMSKESLLMIHNAWMVTSGNADQLRKDADDLEKISVTMANAYLDGTNISKDELKDLLDNETWITAEEAIDYGFATKITDSADKDHPKMSAMTLVNAKLIAREFYKNELTKATAEIIEAIDKKTAEKPAEKQPETITDPHGWSTFFKKGDKTNED